MDTSKESETNAKPKIQFKIGMIAPSGSGKTSLIASICSEVQDRIAYEPLQFWPEGTVTQNAMNRANAEFNTAINNPSNLFQVPKLQPTSDVSEYNFAVTLDSTGQEISFSLLDYPGGLLGTSEFAQKVAPHLVQSAALFVPISADILMYWSQTKELPGTYNAQCNMASNILLDCDNVVLAIKNWIGYKRKVGAPAQLFFVPIKCEKYFDDNGGRVDTHEKLTEAILERYVKPLEMTDKDKQLIQTNIFYIDTYGVVELRDISTTLDKGEVKLIPTFQRRMDLGKTRRTKNAYELLMSILKYQMENRFNLQQVKSEALDKEHEAAVKKAEEVRKRYEIAKQKARDRENSYSIFGAIWYTFFTDDELERLEQEAARAFNGIEAAEKAKEVIFDQCRLSMDECKALGEAVDTLKGLFISMPNRQYPVR